jgi:hypothetical protein
METKAGVLCRSSPGASGSVRPGVLALLLGALALTACGKPAASVLSPPASSTTTLTATANASVNCGTYVLSQGQKVPDAAYRCFIEAVGSGRPAELKETRPTVEGDPVPISYVGDATGKIQRITDSRKDAFGTKTVTWETCTGPIIVRGGLTFAGCAPARPNK